jgi:hypothetical protein
MLLAAAKKYPLHIIIVSKLIHCIPRERSQLSVSAERVRKCPSTAARFPGHHPRLRAHQFLKNGLGGWLLANGNETSRATLELYP